MFVRCVCEISNVIISYIYLKCFCSKNNNELKSITSAYSYMDLTWCLFSGLNFWQCFWLLFFWCFNDQIFTLIAKHFFAMFSHCFSHSLYYEQECFFLVFASFFKNMYKFITEFRNFYIFLLKNEKLFSVLLQIKHYT